VSIALLQLAEARLPIHRPARQWLRPIMRKRAAVALMLQLREGELGVLMIRRAEREGDPWSGQMAFPGGRMEREDVNGLAGGAPGDCGGDRPASGRREPCLGRLSELNASTRRFARWTGDHPLRVPPPARGELHLNYEVQEVVWVPLEFLLNPDNRSEMTWERGGVRLKMPCYDFEGRRIWGLSLRMLDELMDVVAGKSPRRPPWRRF
jgi:hypothetical protein